ncbi:sulfite exporter TauE/SafE family protein [bacterium]|nr:sulfite exporter TauE/SafE family protein [bacterium]
MYHFSPFSLIVLIFAGILIGLSKTAVPGIGAVSIPLFASVMPAKASTGLMLTLIIFADMFAVLYYRRQALWGYLIKLIPWAFLGIIVGYLLLGKIDDKQLRYAIGIIILSTLAISHWKDKWNTKQNPSGILGRWWFAALLGLVAGAATMMANAAGPIMSVYLISMRVPKNRFIGTAAWYFFILNWIKVPFSVSLGFINPGSLKLTLILLPSVAIGAIGGVFLLKKMPEKIFSNIVKVLTAAAAIKLLI